MVRGWRHKVGLTSGIKVGCNLLPSSKHQKYLVQYKPQKCPKRDGEENSAEGTVEPAQMAELAFSNWAAFGSGP